MSTESINRMSVVIVVHIAARRLYIFSQTLSAADNTTAISYADSRCVTAVWLMTSVIYLFVCLFIMYKTIT